jgi:hypothetical protein
VPNNADIDERQYEKNRHEVRERRSSGT